MKFHARMHNVCTVCNFNCLSMNCMQNIVHGLATDNAVTSVASFTCVLEQRSNLAPKTPCNLVTKTYILSVTKDYDCSQSHPLSSCSTTTT